MIARQYDKKIKIFQTGFIEDGFAGTNPDPLEIGSFWAEIKQNSAFRDNSIGASDIKNNYSFKIRATPKITPNNIDNLYIVYKGQNYIVNDIRYNDELFRELNIIANGIAGD